MHRRLFLTTLAAGIAASTGLAMGTAEAAPIPSPSTDLAGVRAALGTSSPSRPSALEMRRRGGGFRGGRGFRRGWGGGGRWRGGAGAAGGSAGVAVAGVPAGAAAATWGPRPWGPRPWGPPRRCFYNRWGELICRRPPWRRPIWW